ncbi:DUF742 domain-containing protein [Streptomyces sp. NBC_01390]|uniref:DUF742 domain-containing protein n=1 Tax=Streptomyces sp. NBC_01390 TaxID=2903850 RepID=UPI003249A436
MTARRDSRRLVPEFLATAGRARPTRNTLDRLTVLYATGETVPDGLEPPERRLVEIALEAVVLAEAAAHLRLPVSIVRVLVSDLMDRGHLKMRAPVPAALQHEPQLLERVLSGLRAVR